MLKVHVINLGMLFAIFAATSATAFPITQVDGKFTCAGLDNQQLCAEKAERTLLAAHPGLAHRDKGAIQIRLRSGGYFRLSDPNSAFNIVDQSPDGAFLAVREQFSEGNTWRLLDLRNSKMTEIKGYPLFSPDGTEFVAASEDLEADYSDTVFDVWKILPKGIVQIFQGIPKDGQAWAARHVRWDGNTVIHFAHTVLEKKGFVEQPAVLVFENGKWTIL